MRYMRAANVGLLIALLGLFVAPWYVTLAAVLVSVHLAWRGVNDLTELDR